MGSAELRRQAGAPQGQHQLGLQIAGRRGAMGKIVLYGGPPTSFEGFCGTACGQGEFIAQERDIPGQRP